MAKAFSQPPTALHIKDDDPHQRNPRVKSPRSLQRFLAYVWPFTPLITMAVMAGLVKFLLPSTMALSLRFLTDRLVATHVAPAAHGSQAQHGQDVIIQLTEAYLTWMSRHLPTSFQADTQWGLFNILMFTLVIVYALWGVSFYFRSYLAQLAGHRVILNLRMDLYQHITRMGHAFFQTRQSGGIVSRLMADVALAQNFVGNAMTAIWMDLASCIFYIYVLYTMDPP